MSRVAVVTGAASGMGLAVARRLASRRAIGSHCWISTATPRPRRRGPAARRRRRACDEGRRDRPRAPSTTRWRCARELGPIEIMVTSAGFDEFASFTDITLEAWNRMIEINLTGHVPLHPGRDSRHARGGLGPDRDDLVVERAVGRGAHGALRRVEGRRGRAHQGAWRSSTRRTASRSTRSLPVSSTRRWRAGPRRAATCRASTRSRRAPRSAGPERPRTSRPRARSSAPTKPATSRAS